MIFSCEPPISISRLSLNSCRLYSSSTKTFDIIALFLPVLPSRRSILLYIGITLKIPKLGSLK